VIKMEINVTKFVENEDMGLYSGSIAELGPDAARLAWGNCLEAAQDPDYQYLDTEEKRDAARDWFYEYGAWDNREEIDEWTDTELLAVFLQDVAAAMREYEGLDGDYQSMLEQRESGRLYPTETLTEWWFDLGT
jgi:hypothetical protein